MGVRTRVKTWLVIPVLIVSTVSGPAFAKRDYGPHSGYLATVQEERDTDYQDVVFPPLPPKKEADIREKIFNEKLTKEFRDRYEEKFGRTEVERVYNSSNRFTYYSDLYGFKGTPQDLDDERRRYGDFVLRRLLEFHVDNYAQHDPKLRPAWEAKERIKEFKVEVGKVQLDAQYSIAGNTFELRMRNPYFYLLQVRWQMDPGAFGPAPLQETTYSVGYRMTRTIVAESHFKSFDGTVAFIQRKSFTDRFGVSLSESTFVADSGVSPRESKYLAGLTYIF